LKTETVNALDDFDATLRHQALQQAAAELDAGTAPVEPPVMNLHMHTFYSYNMEGHSPSYLAWKAKQAGMIAAGMVDFDVLDGVEEFLAASRLLGLRACAGIETRVFVPEFKDDVINSPGEPGIAYHLGLGIPGRKLADREELFLQSLRETAGRRNRGMVERVNAYLAPAAIDYDQDVLPRTPAGNATERHLCTAYALKAAAAFPDPAALAAFWSEKLDLEILPADLPDSNRLLDRLRGKTMKQGGVGYVAPDPETFPRLDAMNAFVLGTGGIPAVAWLNGETDGERQMERWMDVAMASGTAALNLIPDRNIAPGKQATGPQRLKEVMELAEARALPVAVGTELNAPGQPFIDAFESPSLQPWNACFTQSAYILFAHTALQRHHQRGYLSDWAREHFPVPRERNRYFAQMGQAINPHQPDILPDTDPASA
jgi:hypothetical protein